MQQITGCMCAIDIVIGEVVTRTINGAIGRVVNGAIGGVVNGAIGGVVFHSPLICRIDNMQFTIVRNFQLITRLPVIVTIQILS